MRLSIRSFAVVAAAAAACSAAPVSAQTYTPGRILKGVKLDDLKAIVASFKETVTETDVAGETSLAAKTAEGTIYVLIGTACDDKALGCQGVNMQVRFDADSVDLKTVNDVNLSEQAIQTWYDAESKTLGFTRYVVLDHGITMENLRENVNVLLAIVADAQDRFKTP